MGKTCCLLGTSRTLLLVSEKQEAPTPLPDADTPAEDFMRAQRRRILSLPISFCRLVPPGQ